MWNRAAKSSWLRPSARRMIFTCGVRFMLFMSSGCSGWASGSFTAAACRCRAVMASNRVRSCRGSLADLFVVLASFMGCGSSRRDETDFLASQGVGDIQHAVVHQAQNDIAVFAVRLTVIEPLQGKGVVKHLAGGREGDAVGGVVGGGFAVVPLEAPVIHERTA